ncbi:MAG: hypothetical protein JWP69_47 [Flaviaesturariibacter sp.]|nr:hypothetical protein [Flaviaesturariibacter sp.]
MKKLVCSFGILCLCFGTASAQKPSKKKGSNKPVETVSHAKRATPADTTFSLTSTSANNALANRSNTGLYIADPTIQTFNTRVFANLIPDDEQAIIGIPKISTGIGHGRILFYPTTSSTAGTNTGSGTVGTGMSLGNVGTSGRSIGVNGKNPYAGPGIYGTRVISDLRPNSALAKPVVGRE